MIVRELINELIALAADDAPVRMTVYGQNMTIEPEIALVETRLLGQAPVRVLNIYTTAEKVYSLKVQRDMQNANG